MRAAKALVVGVAVGCGAPAASLDTNQPGPVPATRTIAAAPSDEAASAPADPMPVPEETSPAPEAKAARPAFDLPTVPRSVTVARVLLYHTIGWTELPRPGVKPNSLRDQIRWMRENDVEIVRLLDLIRFLEGEIELPAKVAVITIDDGEKNGYTRAFPVFKEHGVPFTLGLYTEGMEKWASRGTLRWAQVREMLDSGLCELASHSHTHRNMTRLERNEVRDELERPREIIERETGVRPVAFFYPLGAVDDRVIELTREAGYRAAFAASGDPVDAGTPAFRIPRYSLDDTTSLYGFARFFRHR